MFKHTILPNGLTAASYHMPFAGSVHITILVKVGSRYEEAYEHGISHFLEHMAFKGTKSRTYKQIAQEFDDIGGRFNAATGKETTIYYAKVLEDKLSDALHILADILKNSIFDQREITKEKMVVLEEMASVNDNIDQLNYERFLEQSFQDQPIGRTILGTENTLKSFSQSNLNNYIKKHYSANNIVIAVSGQVKHQYFITLIQNLFGDLKPNQTIYPQKATYTPGITLFDKKSEQINMILGFEATSYKDTEAFYQSEMLALILGGGTSSRLFQNIREKHALVYSVGSALNCYSDTGIFYVYASCKPEKYITVLEKITEEINNLGNLITEDELERAKNQIKANLIMDEELVSYKSEIIAQDIALLGKHINANEIFKQIKSFSIQDLLLQAKNIFASRIVFSGIGSKITKEYDKINEKISTSII